MKPDTFVRWHRAGFRLFWRWKSRHAGRPPLPKNLRALIVTMARENPSWGEGRIADGLSLKLGLFVDSRTIGKYLKQGERPRPPSGQRWATFVRNHASGIVACDFFTSVTVTFQVLYVFVAIEIGSRGSCTADHPTAEWTRQQLREFLDGESGHRYLIHDRDSVFSAEVDAALNGFGLKVLKTPIRSPMALMRLPGRHSRLLGRIEGNEETVWFWLSSGRWELMCVSGGLSVRVPASVLVWDCTYGQSPDSPRVEARPPVGNSINVEHRNTQKNAPT